MKTLATLFLFLFSCSNNSRLKDTEETGKTITAPSAIDPVRPGKEAAKTTVWNIKDFYALNTELDNHVDSIYHSFSNAEKAAQMIMVATSEYKGIGLPFKDVKELYRNHIAGSVLFLKGRRPVFTREISELNKVSRTNDIAPALFACDCEPSLFHKKFTDADSVTPASQLKTINDVKESARFISTEMKKMGIHWNLAPVVDVNSNKEIIDSRSFGDNNSDIIEKSAAFIQASAEYNIAATLKHFPGHGAVKGDSHKKMVYIDSAFTELDNFYTIIRLANPVSVMVGHIAVNNNTPFGTSWKPATLSQKIVTGLLKDSAGFRGIAITDAMNMAAVKNFEDAGFRAVQAGNDIILIPENARLLHARIVALLKGKGEMSDRVTASVKRIIRLKICMGLY